MRERSQILAGPIPVAEAWSPAYVGALVTADVLARRAAADEGHPVPIVTAVLPDGLRDDYVVEEDLRREGLDKAQVGREAFAARSDDLAERARRRLAAVAGRLGVAVAVDGAAAASAGQAASTAFVRLFDAGLVMEAERVVDVCPRCATVVATTDAVAAELDGEALVVRLPLVDAGAGAAVEVRCLAPELLPGVVAVAVPESHEAAGAMAVVPLAAAVVPVVAEASAAQPTLVIPGHDAGALALARRLGLGARAVVDRDGVVCAAGPLEGLARYGARAAARQLLAAEAALAGAEPAPEPATRCPACRTVLVPVLDRHWFLSLGDLEVAAADAVRDGRLAVTPAAARDELLAAGRGPEEWCLSGRLWTGRPLPVARCADCGHVDVSVDTPSSCGSCMGHLEVEDLVLDPRFVRCMWPLSAAGWPEGRSPGEVAAGTALVLPGESLPDVLAMVALALRLSGDVPFGEVVVLPPVPGGEEVPADLEALATSECAAVLRVALCGPSTLPAARDLVARLDAVPAGPADVDRLDDGCAAAFDAAAPAAALALISGAVAAGVPPADAGRVRALAAPFVGG